MVDSDRDENSGRFTPSYPTGAFLEAIDDHAGVATTSEIADAVGCDRRTAYKRLTTLEEENRVDSRKSNRVRLWSVPEENDG
jgi:uncharacterized membrane protein